MTLDHIEIALETAFENTLMFFNFLRENNSPIVPYIKMY